MVVFDGAEQAPVNEVKQVKKLYSNKYLEDLLMLDISGGPAMNMPYTTIPVANIPKDFQNIASSKFTTLSFNGYSINNFCVSALMQKILT